MASERIALYLFIGIGALSLFYQTIGRDLWIQSGIGNKIQPISDFPYTCRRLNDPGWEACEDMWLSEATRQLFMACSNSSARKDWMPNIHRLNAKGRSTSDRIHVLDIDVPHHTDPKNFRRRMFRLQNYFGIHGDNKIHLVAINGVDNPPHIDLYVNNNRPSVHRKTGKLLDNEKVGANATIEHFRILHTAIAVTGYHQKTYYHPQIATPNRMAPTASGGFYFTNDHGTNTHGLWHHLSPILKTGDVSYCSAEGECKRVAKGLAFPNGLALGKKDGLLYVPSTSSGTITVYKPQPDNSLKLVDTIRVGYPLDNISEDANGDYYVAAFPKLFEALPGFDDPLSMDIAPSTVFKISKKAKGYHIEKVLEDRDGKALPVSTVAVHDAKTGRIFLGGVVSPFITVCDPK